MHDTDQMLINEVHKLERAIAARVRAVEALEKVQPLKRLPRRYTVDLEWEGGDLLAKSNNFVVAEDCERFECFAITHTLFAVGTTTLSESSLGTVSSNYVQSTMPFVWRVVNTSAGRPWQNGWLPWTLMGGGTLQPRWLPTPVKVLPGADIRLEVKPVNSVTSAAGPFTSLARYRLQAAFVGVEVLP